MKRRVVVTGIGIKSPIGNSLEDFTKNLFSKSNGLVNMSSWNEIKGLNSKVAGIVQNIEDRDIPRKNRRSMDRNSTLAILATQDAIENANLKRETISSFDTGLSYGSTIGGARTLEGVFGNLKQSNSYEHQTSMDFLKYMSNTVCSNLSSFFNIKGMNLPICSACTTSSQAIGFSYEMIKNNLTNIMICGGSEAMHPALAVAFDVIGAASTNFNDKASNASRPFDKKRDGVVVSEGSATLILENLESALKRDAKIYAEIVSFATNCNGGHITDPKGESIIDVMKSSLKNANLHTIDIDYLNAHATSTKIGDIVESKSIYEVFKDKVKVSSIKGQIGHTLAACGAIESIASILSIKNKKIPANLNIELLDKECANLDYVNDIINYDVRTVMKNNFAFGGINTSLIFKEFERV